MRAMGGKTTRAIVWCHVGTFPSVWDSFALGPEHRLDHPACGVDDGGRILWTLPIVQHRAMGRPEPSAVRWQCPVSSQRRTLSSRSDLPRRGREKSARRAVTRSPHGGHYGVVVDFSGPVCNYRCPSSHVEWRPCPQMDLDPSRRSMVLCVRRRALHSCATLLAPRGDRSGRPPTRSTL